MDFVFSLLAAVSKASLIFSNGYSMSDHLSRFQFAFWE